MSTNGINDLAVRSEKARFLGLHQKMRASSDSWDYIEPGHM